MSSQILKKDVREILAEALSLWAIFGESPEFGATAPPPSPVAVFDEHETLPQDPFRREESEYVLGISRRGLEMQQIAGEQPTPPNRHHLRRAFPATNSGMQVWAYEVFPNIGREFGCKMSWRSDFFPRMLHWSTAGRPPIDDIKTFFTAKGGLQMKEIRMSVHEIHAVGVLKVVRLDCPHTVPKAKGKAIARAVHSAEVPSVFEVSAWPPSLFDDYPPDRVVDGLTSIKGRKHKKKKCAINSKCTPISMTSCTMNRQPVDSSGANIHVARTSKRPRSLAASCTNKQNTDGCDGPTNDVTLLASIAGILKSVNEIKASIQYNTSLLMQMQNATAGEVNPTPTNASQRPPYSGR